LGTIESRPADTTSKNNVQVSFLTKTKEIANVALTRKIINILLGFVKIPEYIGCHAIQPHAFAQVEQLRPQLPGRTGIVHLATDYQLSFSI
jgi:hypothetical protein